jgi:DNA repair exonuclease SbcCD ATPase subunit
MDEAKKFQKEALAYHNEKAKKRRSLGPMADFDGTRDKVKTANERYQNLKTASDALLEKLQTTKEKQKDFEDVLECLHDWVDGAEERMEEMKDEPVKGDANDVRDDLNKVKAFSAEAIAQGKQFEDLKKNARALMEALQDLGADDQTLVNIDQMVGDIKERLADVNSAATDKSNTLQTALVQSQGVQEGIDSLLSWTKEAEQILNAMRPISLDSNVLNEQMQELQVLRSDVESHVPSMQEVNKSGQNMADSCADDRKAKEIGDKLGELNKRFDDVADRCRERGDDLADVSEHLAEFQDYTKKYEDWINPCINTLESKETSQLDVPLFKEHIEEVKGDAEEKGAELETIKRLGDDLVNNPVTGDVRPVQDKVSDCQKSWDHLTNVLADREQEAKARENQADQFEGLHDEIMRWLVSIETKVDNLEPVAIDLEIIAKQIEELQVREYVCVLWLT